MATNFVQVKLKIPFGMNNAGEVCGFPLATAERLVKNGVAIYWPQPVHLAEAVVKMDELAASSAQESKPAVDKPELKVEEKPVLKPVDPPPPVEVAPVIPMKTKPLTSRWRK